MTPKDMMALIRELEEEKTHLEDKVHTKIKID